MIKAILSDCDGVLTDGFVYTDEFGRETRRYCTYDGTAIKRAENNGITVYFITNERNECHMRRAEKLGVRIFQTNDKGKWAKDHIKVPFAAITDTDSDVGLLRIAKCAYVPKNAPFTADENVKIVRTNTAMGCGVLDEVVSRIIEHNKNYAY